MTNLTSYDTKKLVAAFKAAQAVAVHVEGMVFRVVETKKGGDLSHQVEVYPDRSRAARFKFNGSAVSRAELQDLLDHLVRNNGWVKA
jgi:hypothetical protein